MGKVLTPKQLQNKVHKRLIHLNKYSFYELYGIFLAKAQLIEFELKGLLERKFKYKDEELSTRTLGWVIRELGKKGLRLDFVFLLMDLLDYRNNLVHDLLSDDLLFKKFVGIKAQRFAEKILNHALYKIEEVIQVYDWLNKNDCFTFKKNINIGKKVLVFTEGTILYHTSAIGKTRKEIVEQIKNKDKSVHKYSSYIPIKHAVNKLKIWEYQGVKITYLTSRKKKKEIEEIKKVLNYWDFPKGEVYFRKETEDYKDVAKRIKPDILIEDDCESIGGELEMIYLHISEKFKKTIKSIIVKEFEGIDDVKI